MNNDITHTAGRLIRGSISTTTHDIEVVIGKIKTGRTLAERFSFSDLEKRDSYEIAELYAGVSFTASLTAYRRNGESWLLDYVDQHSERGRLVTRLMDDLRDLLITYQYEAFRLLCRHTTLPHVRRGLALMFICLDAVDAANLSAFKSFAGISQRCGDAQGDAQLLAEEHHLGPDTGLWPESPNMKFKS
ncbi:hypothetical protein [Loktanella sp. M215]|uniref:hypothetical protein n=1 Tax=Loktanella sp. M215 TaxID=2675431 RepID=UPI001F41FA86|nr:hypothetical protein [Loktanella sp. M215]MCF7699880.1 hypothetical protein [Loktanella sp. M215]